MRGLFLPTSSPYRLAQRRRATRGRSPDAPRRARAQPSLAASALAACAVTACAAAPQTLPARLDAALAAGDREAVLELLTPASAGLVQAMWQASDVAAPLLPARPQVATEVIEAVPLDSATIALHVRAGERQDEWLLRRHGLQWRLDLLAGSQRLPSVWPGGRER